jgi:hypothetical protein
MKDPITIINIVQKSHTNCPFEKYILSSPMHKNILTKFPCGTYTS